MSGPDAFPPGGVRALLNTGHVTEPTRRALQAKLDRPPSAPRFFEPGTFATLTAVCDRLIPQSPRAVDIAGGLDQRLADNKRDGWRYDVMPPDQEAYRRGLAGVDDTAQALFGADFVGLSESDQEAVLQAVSGGEPPGATWTEMPAAYWFEELLVEVSEIYFAHPLAQQAMGYLGMADAQGWAAVGLNRHEADDPLSSRPPGRAAGAARPGQAPRSEEPGRARLPEPGPGRPEAEPGQGRGSSDSPLGDTVAPGRSPAPFKAGGSVPGLPPADAGARPG